MSKYEQVVKEASTVDQTKWAGPTQSVTAPKNVKLAIITCDAAVLGCQQATDGAQEAAQALGWEVHAYNGQSDPTRQDQLIQQAVSVHSTAILLSSVDPSVVKSGLAAAQQAGIPVASMQFGGITPTDTIAYEVAPNFDRIGEIEGNWLVADSKGKGVILPFSDNEFRSVQIMTSATQKVVETCSTCQWLETQLFVATQIGPDLGARAVSALQKNQRVTHIYGTFDPAAAAVGSAVAAAGYKDKVRMIGHIGGEQNLADIAKGRVQAADVTFDEAYVGWAAVDQMVRVLSKQPLWQASGEDELYAYSEGVPMVLITKENVPANGQAPFAEFNKLAYAKFKELWGVN